VTVADPLALGAEVNVSVPAGLIAGSVETVRDAVAALRRFKSEPGRYFVLHLEIDTYATA
jgi:hypothetical protein